MNDLESAFKKHKHGLAYFYEEDWDIIVSAWWRGVSGGELYRWLASHGQMPYKSDRSFFRALENARIKRQRNTHGKRKA